jgi:hypothetical protein
MSGIVALVSYHDEVNVETLGTLFTQRMMESPQPPKVFSDFWTLAYGGWDKRRVTAKR